ncbi:MULTISPECIES: YebC/PmpR family DNA-binding transcriptional regulator [unclassified Campylobacter]|uniref:YebC/PmpR family DNA-binding transcriptional regulator n=1 Tax=unclassified Campylobacter TaxID=2593542 RepID=UPI001237B263|nr:MULTISPECIES: YebC/PmpR family DNA-binding transcriptional regulator [unclassified Campylobacter]KAA6224891.1 YebC/PmpR family DNA-binding transcriptional regulator [Campylobacter sp. LR185c]KAA6226324.1 YebC/PmpR family DNA-binding transcriptional regulator [Campylobacter sp. LR286c]KAA6226816.1 YebC/PmpR family DNA-binding transcriptional regulator [Campylobacter sp. LR196d]KAA6230253.1 YebC/PmpR family DNA-binding transcriptional regulator [Campylobacter sp. LR291e]KAA6233774.1 YebC/PmpR
MGRAFEYRRASKEARWDKMSKLFPKLAKAIQVAAKEGGIDPEMNPKLRSAIATAKSNNMPKDNIDAAIKRASGKDSADIKQIHYEGKAPHGALIIVECMSDNPTRTVANVKAIFSKNGGEILQNGSLGFMFSRKAVFHLEKFNGDLEELELDLIDAGLEELEQDEELLIIGDYTAFGELSNAICAKNLTIKKAGLEFIPNNPVNFDENQLIDIEKLIDKLDDDDDVCAVYTNIE